MYNCIIINYKQYTIFSDGSGLDSLFCKQLQDSSWTRMGRRLKVFLCIGYIHFGRSSGTLKLFVLVSIPKLRMWPLRPLQWNTMAHETSHIILPVMYHYCRFCSCCHPFASPVNRLANMKAHFSPAWATTKRYIQKWWADPMLANHQRLAFTCHWSIVGSLSGRNRELICRFPGCLKVTVYL